MVLILVRHGETPDNVTGEVQHWAAVGGQLISSRILITENRETKVLSGPNAVGLTPYGMEQAREVGDRLLRLRIQPNKFGHTGLVRPFDTLTLLLEGMKQPWTDQVLVLPELRERYPGIWFGAQRSEVPVAELAPLQDPYVRYRAGEGLCDVAARAIPTVAALAASDELILVAAHELVMKTVLWAEVLGLTAGDAAVWEAAGRANGVNPLVDQGFKVANAACMRVKLHGGKLATEWIA